MTSNLLSALNQSPYYYFFLVVDDSLRISLPQLKYFTPVNSNQFDNELNSGKLLSNPKVRDFIETTSKKHHKLPAIIPFKPSAKIDFICKNRNWLKVSNDSSLNRVIEDKLKFPLICKNHDIPILPFIIDKLNRLSFEKAKNLLGPELIIQTHFGWAGKSTFQADCFDHLKKTIPPDTVVKFSPHLKESYTLLNNCCQTNKGLIQSPPAVQFTGIRSLTTNPFSTVGRQWPSFAPPDIIDQTFKITQKFSDYLEKKHYKGFFGLDFIVDQNKVYLLECNPRLTASFAFYTQIELKANLNPLFLFHLAEFSLKNYLFDITTEQTRFKNPKIIGTQLTRRSESGKIDGKYETNNFIVTSPKNSTIKNEIISKIN
ncbi:MAG: ATP-grasp domain-containing protein [Candidatus Shapirobacteria bacterium]|jgi:hypothetical protein